MKYSLNIFFPHFPPPKRTLRNLAFYDVPNPNQIHGLGIQDGLTNRHKDKTVLR